MSRAERPYVRVYHDDLQRDYPHVWADHDALATFVKLLVVADKMWPAPPELPRSVRPKALVVLTTRSIVTRHALVDIEGAHGFRIRGHHAERSKRQEAARTAAAFRWASERNADASPPDDDDGDAVGVPSPRPSPSPRPNGSTRSTVRDAREASA